MELQFPQVIRVTNGVPGRHQLHGLPEVWGGNHAGLVFEDSHDLWPAVRYLRDEGWQVVYTDPAWLYFPRHYQPYGVDETLWAKERLPLPAPVSGSVRFLRRD